VLHCLPNCARRERGGLPGDRRATEREPRDRRGLVRDVPVANSPRASRTSIWWSLIFRKRSSRCCIGASSARPSKGVSPTSVGTSRTARPRRAGGTPCKRGWTGSSRPRTRTWPGRSFGELAAGLKSQAYDGLQTIQEGLEEAIAVPRLPVKDRRRFRTTN
jgi:hypothetical protein